MSFTDPVVAGTELVRTAIHSPNYVAGTSGWSINQDGSAEFNALTVVGGTFTGGSITMDGAGEGLFIYNGTPAAGNLLLSITPTSGTDPYGNTYPSGVAITNSSATRSISITPGTGSPPIPTIFFRDTGSGEYGWVNSPSPGNMEMSSDASGTHRSRVLSQDTIGTIEFVRTSDDALDGGVVYVAGSSARLGYYSADVLQAAVTVTSTGVEAWPNLSLDGNLVGQWQDYVGPWHSSGTQPSIGNGSIVGRYCHVGNIVHFMGKLTAGSTTTFGTGTYNLALPVASANFTGGNGIIGSCWIRDSSGNDYQGQLLDSGTTFVVRPAAATFGGNAAWGATTPMTMANGDWISWYGTYEAA